MIASTFRERLGPAAAIAGALALGGCGGAQGPASATFCQSYRDNFLTSCQQNCEAGQPEGSQAAIAACHERCQADLQDDDTFDDRCPDVGGEALARRGASRQAQQCRGGCTARQAAAGEPDVVTGLVDMRLARYAASANLAVIRTADEMAETLLAVRGR